MEAQQNLTICVCGAGTMGSGIAQVAAVAGHPTILYDVDPGVLDRARATIAANLQQLENRGKLPAGSQDRVMSEIRFSGQISDCRAGLCIEAIIEQVSAKQELFAQLAAVNGDHSIYATNTSSLSVTGLAAGFRFPERLVGLHFFNPAPLMKLVEIVMTPLTAGSLRAELVSIVEQLGKRAVVCRDSPGFIVNRVARPFYIEALRLAETGAIPFSMIDELMEATGFRMGPFKLMDLIGNDINYTVSVQVYEQLGKPGRLRPSPIQQSLVAAGKLGRKTGQGYYRYPAQ